MSNALGTAPRLGFTAIYAREPTFADGFRDGFALNNQQDNKPAYATGYNYGVLLRGTHDSSVKEYVLSMAAWNLHGLIFDRKYRLVLFLEQASNIDEWSGQRSRWSQIHRRLQSKLDMEHVRHWSIKAKHFKL